MRSLLGALGLATVVLGVALGCRSKPAPGVGGGPALTLTPCRLRGVSEEVRCGTLEVPEDRATGTGRHFTLNVAVVPALAASPAPDPVFLLAGGPGQGAA